MPELTLDDVVLLIHSEVASAVTSAQQYGAMDAVVLDAIRVRMGQSVFDDGSNENNTLSENTALSDNNHTSANNISLNTLRYPTAESGWQIDVYYKAGDSQAGRIKNTHDEPLWLASEAMRFFSQQPVERLSGIGKRWAKLLKQNDVTSIEQLLEHSLLNNEALLEALSVRQLRNFQALARLALSVPAITVPESINQYCLMDALDDYSALKNQLLNQSMTDDQQVQLYNWLQQLEFCFDDTLLKETCFADLRQN